MGAINPLFLLAAVSLAVPLVLHLFHRQQARRISFPALRYLERTERERARQIRARQLLLLFLRLSVLLAVVAAGARLFMRGRGSAHPPTAVVVVLDNSASSGRVVGERRVLDDLKALALRTVGDANPEDRFWVLRAGEPWAAAPAQDARTARSTIEATTVSAAGADLVATLRRARELARAAPLAHRELHVLSDLQASGFEGGEPAADPAIPVVLWYDPLPPPANRALVEVLVGGGLPPLGGERSEISVRASPAAEPGDTAPLPVRLVVDGRIRGAATVPPGAVASMPLPPAPPGWVRGWVETDADLLRIDDRRVFAFRARPPPRVAVTGDAGPFVENALAVLEEAGRIQRSAAAGADLLVAGEGLDLDSPGSRASALVLPPSDAARLPALNRRLSAAGIPWQLGRARDDGEAALSGPRLPSLLDGVVTRRRHAVTQRGDPPAPTRVLAHAAGEAWAVEGNDASGRRYLLLASPLDTESSSLPVSTAMVEFLAWLSGSWATASGEAPDHVAGVPLDAPRTAERARLPSGDVVPVGGTRRIVATRDAGFYEFLAEDSVVTVVAVNPPAREADLTRADQATLEHLLGPSVTAVASTDDWERSVFRVRQGPELWRLALVAALALLLTEALVAAAGRPDRAAARRAGAGGAL